MKDKTIIQKNTKIEGEIYSNEEIIVKGFIKGLIESDNDLQIYNSGKIKGDVKIQNCYSNGIFVGNIETEGQFITDKDSMTIGNIFTKSLKVNNGAKLKCNISMDEELHIESPFVYEEDEYETPIDTEEDNVTTMDISPLPETTNETPLEPTENGQTHRSDHSENESTDEINEIPTAGFNPPPQEDAMTTMDISPLSETTNETTSEQTHPVLAFSQNTPPTEGIEGNENETPSEPTEECQTHRSDHTENETTDATDEVITTGFNPSPQEDAVTTMDISPLPETTNETPSEQTHPVLAESQNTPPMEGIEGNENETPSEPTEEGHTHRSDHTENETTDATDEVITTGFNPSSQEDAASSQEDAVTTMDISPLPETTNETPSESVPMALENAPSALESVPSALESAPSALESVPSALESVPTALENAPSALESVPTALESVPAALENAPSALESVPTALENPITASEDVSIAIENEIALEQTHPVLAFSQNTTPTEGIEGNENETPAEPTENGQTHRSDLPENESSDVTNEIITTGFNPSPQEEALSPQEDAVTTMDISPLPETTNETTSEQTHPVLAESQNTPPTEGIEGNENETSSEPTEEGQTHRSDLPENETTDATDEVITAGFNPPSQEEPSSPQEDAMTTMDISPLPETTNETPLEPTHPVLAESQNTPPTEGIEGNENETPSESTEEGQTHRSDLPEDATNDEITADHNEPAHSIDQNDITILYNMPVKGFVGENMKVEDVNILATAEVTSIKIEENTHIDKQVEVNFLKGIVPNKKNSVIRLFFINYSNDFSGWGVHLWGIDKNKNYIIITDWDKPVLFEKFDETKAYLDISLENLKNCEQIWFIIHKGDEKTEDMYFGNFKKKKEFTYSYIDKKIY